jgi:thiosulfate dehydrogenase
MVMTAPMTRRFILSRAALAGALVAVAVLVGPAGAHKDPVTPQQLTAYQEVFMEQVRKGDLLFHGDAATEKAMDVVLSRTGMACAMCHPMTADTHPHTFPKYQANTAKFVTLRDMINWCIEKPNQGEKIDDDSDAMKALETYTYWSNTHPPGRLAPSVDIRQR